MARLMAPFEPYEPTPRIAVGVSGGADSMALAILIQDWAAARGGSVVALVVDHGLRNGSAVEVRRVGSWLEALGLEHQVLTWRGTKPRTGRQAAARAARYDLLCGWCRRHGVLHLAIGHHMEDQAETLLLRLGRGSGLDGLAGMPVLRELAGLRLLRPFLPVPKARLEATLRSRGRCWIEDPGNRDPAFARVRLRQFRPELDALGLTVPRLVAAAGHLGLARAALERSVTSVLARAAALEPAGYAWLEPEPRLERLQRLYGRLEQGLERGATLGGCRILPLRGRVLVVREPAAAPVVPVRPGDRLRWDGRFDVAVGRDTEGEAESLVLGPLGAADWATLSGAPHGGRAKRVPAAAGAALPALSDRQGPIAVPHLGYGRGSRGGAALRKCDFAPENALVGPRFTVA
jgi:tRNA(Ile)-lysidine synthase